MFPNGDLLLGKPNQDGGVSIWRQGHDGTLVQITAGSLDVAPDASADGRHWVYVDSVRRTIMLCAGTAGDSCSAVRQEDALPAWSRLSPDGNKIAYVTLAGSQQASVLTLPDGGVKRLGAVFAQCPPVWSSATRLWTFEGSAKRYYWIERDVETGRATGRTFDMGAINDANQDPDERRCWPADGTGAGPVFPRLRIETEEISSLLRLSSDVRGR
jgi:hypothetical protein